MQYYPCGFALNFLFIFFATCPFPVVLENVNSAPAVRLWWPSGLNPSLPPTRAFCPDWKFLTMTLLLWDPQPSVLRAFTTVNQIVPFVTVHYV